MQQIKFREEKLKSLEKQRVVTPNNRIFIPLIRTTCPTEIKGIIFQNTDYVAFNYYDIKSNKRIYEDAKSKQIRDAFNIPDKVKVFILTTERDSTIKKLLLNGNFDEFKQDIEDFRADYFMGPDFWNYREMNNNENEEMVKISIKFHLQCIGFDNLIPNIPGVSLNQKMSFIDIFKSQGFHTFIQAGRESLINLAGRKKDEQTIASIISTLKNKKNIKILVTGCSSPRQEKLLYDADGFFGLGYFINAMKRYLIQDDKFKLILKDDTDFFCNNEKCCNSLQPKILAEKENDWRRILHNLFKNQNAVNEKIKFRQALLVN